MYLWLSVSTHASTVDSFVDDQILKINRVQQASTSVPEFVLKHAGVADDGTDGTEACIPA